MVFFKDYLLGGSLSISYYIISNPTGILNIKY